jgi:chromosomal replication initiation ATPase DnaA
MSDKEFIKDLKDYFTEIDWNNSHVERLGYMLGRYRDNVIKNSPVIIKRVEVPVFNRLQYGKMSTDLSVEQMYEILNEVAEDEGVTPEQLTGKERKWKLVCARVEFVRRVLRKNEFQTYASIGRMLGRDHTSVLHYIKKNRKLLNK